jgi:hypothetical protein
MDQRPHRVEQTDRRRRPVEKPRTPPRVEESLAPEARLLRSLQRSAGNRSVAGLVQRTGLKAVRPESSSGAGVVQLARGKIAALPQGLTLAALEAAVVGIDAQIGELGDEHEEVTLGYVDMAEIRGLRTQYDTHIATLRAQNPGVVSYTWDQIKAKTTPMLQAFFDVVTTVGTLRGTLNKAFESREKDKQSEAAAAEAKAQKERPAVVDQPSPYTAKVGSYDHELNGGIVLVEGHFVVVVEHYQLKHNPDLGILQAGGPFKGKKGSALAGGWDAHRDRFAPQALALARPAIARHTGPVNDQTKITLPKQRTADFEVYVTVTRDGPDWIVNYHGNPPG